MAAARSLWPARQRSRSSTAWVMTSFGMSTPVRGYGRADRTRPIQVGWPPAGLGVFRGAGERVPLVLACGLQQQWSLCRRPGVRRVLKLRDERVDVGDRLEVVTQVLLRARHGPVGDERSRIGVLPRHP